MCTAPLPGLLWPLYCPSLLPQVAAYTFPQGNCWLLTLLLAQQNTMHVCMHACLRAQCCLTLCHPVVCSLLSFSVHGVFQARILEWVAISSSRGSFLPKDWTHLSCVSCIVGRFFIAWAIREAQQYHTSIIKVIRKKGGQGEGWGMEPPKTKFKEEYTQKSLIRNLIKLALSF